MAAWSQLRIDSPSTFEPDSIPSVPKNAGIVRPAEGGSTGASRPWNDVSKADSSIDSIRTIFVPSLSTRGSVACRRPPAFMSCSRSKPRGTLSLRLTTWTSPESIGSTRAWRRATRVSSLAATTIRVAPSCRGMRS